MRALSFLFALFLSQEAAAFTLQLQGIHGWTNKYLAININYDSCPIGRDALEDKIDQAIDLWNSVATSNMHLVRGTNSATTAASAYAGTALDSPVIVCDTAMSATLGRDSENIPAFANIAQSSGAIVYGFILLNAEAGKSSNIQNLTAIEFAVALAHEMGHLLGLGHSTDITSMMHYDYSRKDHMRLSQDDIDGLTYLYTRAEPDEDKVFGCASTSSIPPSSNSFLWLLILTLLLLLPLKHLVRLSQSETNRSA